MQVFVFHLCLIKKPILEEYPLAELPEYVHKWFTWTFHSQKWHWEYHGNKFLRVDESRVSLQVMTKADSVTHIEFYPHCLKLLLYSDLAGLLQLPFQFRVLSEMRECGFGVLKLCKPEVNSTHVRCRPSVMQNWLVVWNRFCISSRICHLQQLNYLTNESLSSCGSELLS